MSCTIPIRTSLQRCTSNRRSKEQVMKEGWHEQGYFAIPIESPLINDWERQFLINIANRVYGKRS